ncbi:MAG TPA: methyl-accepting chemotaxis protein [Thermoanaerobaculia bacterium]|jgi:methyl-accepting chemotaxis protein|nr:methyl-accepting chemotaxis protein [Thermoanaerobaculia bacterium]
MARNWTFGQKIGGGFAVAVLLTLIIGAVAVYALREVVASKDRVISEHAQPLIDAQKLEVAAERKSSSGRGYLLVPQERFLDSMRVAREDLTAALERLKGQADAEEARRLIAAMERSDAEYQQALDAIMALRRSAAGLEEVIRSFEERVLPRRDRLRNAVESYVAWEERRLAEARQAASDRASAAILLVMVIAGLALVFAVLIAALLARTLSRQIGTAVGQVQSSSAELQAAANQQATGAREQATAMNEIATTISELLATSRQIAESAQRVAGIADQTVAAARAGEGTVGKAHESIAGIRRQVDAVVNHMLDLGKKSQQIGAVLEIVSELAEQTNILAINATIEAAGAGEAGRRFSVVADEIRKLADRVTGSTKEIRSLIEDVRSAVNTTVMATESGSKSVDAGSKQFADVASAFRQISALVSTTTEASREIELSTKQQTSAVEQVNVAIANVAQATKETEASSSQTLQTASQLAGLSRDLLRLIKPKTA